MLLDSASSLNRVRTCPASASGVFPQVRGETTPQMQRGTDVHKCLEIAQREGRAAAVEYAAKCSPDVSDILHNIDWDVLTIGHGWRPEQGWKWSWKSGKGELIDVVNRKYTGIAEDEFYGTADRVKIEDGCVYVDDYKVGGVAIDIFTAPAKTNLQLRAAALAVCRASGLYSARVRLVFIGTTGRVWFDEDRLERMDLDAVEEELKSLAANVARARDDFAAGRVPATTPSSYCQFCPSLRTCPTQGKAVASLLALPAGAVLTAENLPLAYDKVRMAKKLLADLENAIKMAAAAEPFQTSSGSWYGQVTREEDEIDTNLALQVLPEELKEVACEKTITKASLERAIRQCGTTNMAASKRHILKILKESGAIKQRSYTAVREYKPGDVK